MTLGHARDVVSFRAFQSFNMHLSRVLRSNKRAIFENYTRVSKNYLLYIQDIASYYFHSSNRFLTSLLNSGIAVRRLQNTREYKKAVGTYPDYLQPTSFTEKMQYRKLFDHNPLFPVFCDKLAVRDYVKRVSPELRLPELIWYGNEPGDIPFHTLQPPYVIKPSNSSGHFHKVASAADVDEPAIIQLCHSWLSSPHYARRKSEWGYLQAKGRILVEEFMKGSKKTAYPPDYKFFILGGRAKFISYCSGRSEEYSVTYFEPDWTRMPLCSVRKSGPVPTLREVPRPKHLQDMIRFAERLADGIDQLRVDLYDIDGDVVFGELTVYQRSGYWVPCREGVPVTPFPPRDIDNELGGEWNLPNISRPLQIYRGLLG